MLEKVEAGERLLILSPHLDDAVLSVGGIMEKAKKSGVAVIAGTIFTADADQAVASSPCLKELHSLWGLGDNPSRIRREEDIAAIQSLGCDYVHGNLPDAIYRTDAEGKALYATTTAVFAEPAPKESIWPSLRSLLRQWLDRTRPRIVLCPLTVGRHVDHIVVSDVLRQVWSVGAGDVFLYEDMPYASGFAPNGEPDTVQDAIGRSRWSVGGSMSVPVDIRKKIAAIEMYASQVRELFPGGRVQDAVERYMRLGAEAGYQERLWRVE